MQVPPISPLPSPLPSNGVNHPVGDKQEEKKQTKNELPTRRFDEAFAYLEKEEQKLVADLKAAITAQKNEIHGKLDTFHKEAAALLAAAGVQEKHLDGRLERKTPLKPSSYNDAMAFLEQEERKLMKEVKGASVNQEKVFEERLAALKAGAAALLAAGGPDQKEKVDEFLKKLEKTEERLKSLEQGEAVAAALLHSTEAKALMGDVKGGEGAMAAQELRETGRAIAALMQKLVESVLHGTAAGKPVTLVDLQNTPHVPSFLAGGSVRIEQEKDIHGVTQIKVQITNLTAQQENQAHFIMTHPDNKGLIDSLALQLQSKNIALVQMQVGNLHVPITPPPPPAPSPYFSVETGGGREKGEERGGGEQKKDEGGGQKEGREQKR